MHSIAVITLTRRRPELLLRAIASVTQQQCDAYIEHHIVIDDCPDTRELLEALTLPANARWSWAPRAAAERGGLARVAKLRNAAIRAADTTWIAILDDDNVWHADHLASLLACAEREAKQAVHSHMALWRDPACPYLEPRVPWCRDRQEAEVRYWNLVRKGVFVPGSNVVRDRVDPLDHPDPVRTVDLGEWLLARRVLDEIPLREEYSQREELAMVGEDDKLMIDLLHRGVSIMSTRLPSLNYYLGGFSNHFSDD